MPGSVRCLCRGSIRDDRFVLLRVTVDHGKHLVPLGFEGRHHRRVHRRLAWKIYRLKVKIIPIFANAEIEVRTRGKTGGADKTNLLALFYLLSCFHLSAGEMHIVRLEAVCMTELDEVAGPARAAGKGNRPSGYGLDGGSGGRCVVNTEVGATGLQNGVKTASGETGTDARCEFQRGS